MVKTFILFIAILQLLTDYVVAYTEHEQRFASIVSSENIFGVQFHLKAQKMVNCFCNVSFSTVYCDVKASINTCPILKKWMDGKE